MEHCGALPPVEAGRIAKHCSRVNVIASAAPASAIAMFISDRLQRRSGNRRHHGHRRLPGGKKRSHCIRKVRRQWLFYFEGREVGAVSRWASQAQRQPMLARLTALTGPAGLPLPIAGYGLAAFASTVCWQHTKERRPLCR
jgi:hypothetical protein